MSKYFEANGVSNKADLITFSSVCCIWNGFKKMFCGCFERKIFMATVC